MTGKMQGPDAAETEASDLAKQIEELRQNQQRIMQELNRLNERLGNSGR